MPKPTPFLSDTEDDCFNPEKAPEGFDREIGEWIVSDEPVTVPPNEHGFLVRKRKRGKQVIDVLDDDEDEDIVISKTRDGGKQTDFLDDSPSSTTVHVGTQAQGSKYSQRLN